MAVNIHEAKTHLSRLIERVLAGEEVIIARGGTPVAKLVPIGAHAARRAPGSARGSIRLAEDFGAPLPEEIQGPFG